MKKIFATLIGLAAATTLLHAQGLVEFNGGVGATTNTTLYGSGYPSTTSGTSGSTFGSLSHPGLYDFVLLYATSTNSADEGNPLGADWSVVDIFGAGVAYATNSVAAGSIQGPNAASGFSSSLLAGTTYYVMAVGWSASLGNSWTNVEALLSTDFSSNTTPGYFGYSAIGTLDPSSSPSPATDAFTGAGIPNGSLILYAVPVPEPTTLALAGLGGVSLLLFRRRNRKT